jgi:hypothetical protein
VLLGQDCADEADQGVAVGEDPDDVGGAPDLFVEPFLMPHIDPAILRLIVASFGTKAVELQPMSLIWRDAQLC